MSYTALYRKFRPDTFADVKGQDHIVTTLRNQIRANRIGHAYLFTGTRGTGKTTIAKILAKAVNCEHPTEDGPCCECDTCKAITAGASMDVMEIDAASNNSVDNIRELIEEVSYSPVSGKYKVYIIDEAHMLSAGAFNALLKTLEEPPPYVIFILATTEVHKFPVTILSRCQRYDFKRISIDTIVNRLQELMQTEEINVDARALRYIAKLADGSMRDALSLLDQCIAFHLGETLTYDMVLDVLGAVDTEVFSRLLRYVMDRNVMGCITLVEEIVMQGRELTSFVSDFTWYMRNLLLVQTSDHLEDVIDMSTDNLARLKEEAVKLEAEQIIRYIRIFSELSSQLRYSMQKRILVEIALIKLCRPQMEENTDALLDRVCQLEKKVENGVAIVHDASQTESFAEQPKKQIKLERAVPQDIKEIVSKWPGIVGCADNPLKQYLKKVRLSLAEGDKLMLVTEDDQTQDYFSQYPENRELVETLLADFSGKQIDIVFQYAKCRQEADSNYIDLSEIIHMEIEEDE